MSRTGVALFVRPNFDRATSYGHHYMNLAAIYAAQNMAVIDLPGVDATKSNIMGAFVDVDPVFCYFNGHGNADTYTAQNKEVVMVTCSGDESLIERVVLLLSCSCGIRLAPSAISKGATTVFAWVVDFTWIAIEDPATDAYAKGFFESVNVVSNALAEGKTTQEAMDLSLASWNEWIDYWAGSSDPYASSVIQWLIHDRDGQKLFGDTSARITTAIPDVGKVPVPMPFMLSYAVLLLSLI